MWTLINLFHFKTLLVFEELPIKERSEQTRLKVLATSHSDYMGIAKTKW